MSWSDVGGWLKDNAGNGAALIGSLLTGNVMGAVAAGASMVSGVTGSTDPSEALKRLQADPALIVELEKVKNEREAEVNRHLETITLAELEDVQKEHDTTARVIIEGQKNAEGGFEKNSRPAMAWVSLLATIVYAFYALENALTIDVLMVSILSGGYIAWMGLRTIDKKTLAKGSIPNTLLEKIARSVTKK